MIPQGFIPAVEKGVRDALAHGAVAGYPVKGVRVTLVDGSYHTVDSSEQAFRTAGLDRDEGGADATPARCCWSRSCS